MTFLCAPREDALQSFLGANYNFAVAAVHDLKLDSTCYHFLWDLRAVSDVLIKNGGTNLIQMSFPTESGEPSLQKLFDNVG